MFPVPSHGEANEGDLAMKLKEHAVWADIERRSGSNVLPDGERVRPYYLGRLSNLKAVAHKPSSSSAKAAESNTSGDDAQLRS
jgi:hypothetical protein